MTNMKKNNHGTRASSDVKNGMKSSCFTLEKLFFGALVIGEDYGACGMFSANLNCSRNFGVTPFATIFFNILTGFSPLNKVENYVNRFYKKTNI